VCVQLDSFNETSADCGAVYNTYTLCPPEICFCEDNQTFIPIEGRVGFSFSFIALKLLIYKQEHAA